MKNFRNYFYVLLFVPILSTSCSDDSDEASEPVIGCSDPGAVNYNPNADQQGECLYSLVGDWTAYHYTIDNQDVLYAFSYFDIHVYDDSSFILEAEAIDGTYLQSTGVGSYDEESNTLTLTPDNGSAAEVWNLTYIDSEYLYMNYTDASGFHDTEWVKY